MQASTHAQYQQQLNANKLPLAIRVYGVLLLLDALVSIPTFVLLGLDTVRSLYANPITHTPTLTSILAYTDGVLQFGIMTALVALGISILQNRRIRVARYAYAIMPFTVAQGLIDLALYGVNAHQLSALLQMVILIAVSVTADPSLFDERQLQRKLKSMNARDVYEEALRINMVGRDLSGKGYIELNFFNLFWVFVVSSVIGLGIETVYHFILFGEYQDRAGLLFGPFSPIYGFGGVLLTMLLNRLYDNNVLLVFFASAVIGGAFEYATSWFMQVAFGITAWDYTGQWLSIDGRTSGKYMIMWGVLGVVWLKLCLPNLLKLINKIPWKWRYSVTLIALILMLVDIVMTLMALDCWFTRATGIAPSSPIEQFFATYFNNDVMAYRFQTMHLDPSSAGRL